MGEVIVYQREGGYVSVVIPANCGIPIGQIGEKDVPEGLPFWIVPGSSVPVDRAARDAWEIDVESMGQPDGFGGSA